MTTESPSVARPLTRPEPGTTQPSRAELLDAALTEFADFGYDGTSVRRLARRLGVHHNHFPQRFGTKERLWYAAVDHGVERLVGELRPIVEAEQPDEMHRLGALLVRFVEATADQPAILRVVNREAVLGGERFDYLYTTYIGPVFDEVRGLLDRLARRGLVRDDAAPAVLFFAINGAGGGPATFPHLTRRLGHDAAADDADARHRHAVAAVEQLFEGLATR